MSRTCPLCNGSGTLEARPREQDDTLFDAGAAIVEMDQEPPAHRAARAAEQLARLAIAPHAGTLRRRVLDLALGRDFGITSIEATEALVYEDLVRAGQVLGREQFELAVRKKLYSIAPRLTELVDGGWLADSDEVRGKRMVYRATDKARAEAA
jgi:hypothetical protein